MAAPMPVSVVNQVGQHILRELFGTKQTVFSAVTASVDHGAATGIVNGTVTRSVHRTPTHTVVNRAKSVALKGKIVLISAELVPLDTYVGYLTTSEERL